MGNRQDQVRDLQAEVVALRRRVAELETAAAARDQAATTEDALRRREAAAEAILESASEGIVIADERQIVRVNAAAERMFGYDRRELIGQPLARLLPERFRELHAQHQAGYFAAPRVRPMGKGLDLAARRRDGSEFPVEISLSFAETEQGCLAIGFITDITERKRTATELHRQQGALYQSEKLAALGTLAAGLAHEINNPIGIISSRIELMLSAPENEGLSAEVREDLDVLQRNVRRVGKIASALLSFARRSSSERGPVDLNRVVRETLFLAEAQLTRRGLKVTATLEPTLPPLQGDANALQQVTLNLLQNAAEALGEQGEIRIETRRPMTERMELVVADNGPGIPSEHLPRIFDPFFTTKPNGTGLGLAVCYGIVEEHQGRVEVESKPGKGTMFTVSFPVLSGMSGDGPGQA